MKKETKVLGKYGMMRRKFLQEQHPAQYSALLASGELSEHLHSIDVQAASQVSEMVDNLAKDVAVDKQRHPDEWTQTMNSLKHQAEEIVCNTLIFV